MIKFSVTKNGIALDRSLYTWDEKTKTFSTNEMGLVLDFRTLADCTFRTGSDCTFKTGSDCTFDTSFDCIFDTGSNCTFKTGSGCVFDTGSDCTFRTGSNCIFDTGANCTFKTGADCTFDTGADCAFDTGADCVVVRRDIFEVIKLKEGKKIRLNKYRIPGYIEVGKTKEEIIDKVLEKLKSLSKEDLEKFLE